MNRLLLTICIICLVSGYSTAQDKYIVTFKNKNSSPFSIQNPSAYLSNRAIVRRQKQGIAIDSTDLPITPTYLQQIQTTGAFIFNQSKWYNFAQVGADSAQIASIAKMSHVKSIKKVFGKNLRVKNRRPKAEMGTHNPKRTQSEYGGADNQINMLNGKALHNMGYRGKGIIIAVIDAGFLNANNLEAFDSLFSTGRILATHDFVTNTENVYDDDAHGTNVLSTIGANVPNIMIGTAPDASFILLRSEDAPSEFLTEEYNWIAAAEYADSIGVDVINTSLGYTEFDASSQNHTRADMNGETTIITRAADLAVSKGIVVLASAGNEGNDPWHYIGAPADGKKLLAIGAVDPSENIAAFSSRGPSVDGRVKPNVCAQGQDAYITYSSGNYGTSNGTSFSSPIMTGMAACLIQSQPNKKASEIIDAIERSASQYNTPDSSFGYGIPDFVKAYTILSGLRQKSKTNEIAIYPNPTSGDLNIKYTSGNESEIHISIFDMLGKQVFQQKFSVQPNSELNILNTNISSLVHNACYQLLLNNGNAIYNNRLIIE